MQINKFSLGGIAPFELQVAYNSLSNDSPDNVNDSHIHNECEIYVNVSGDVSFEVEGTVYPVVSGNAIITRPGEYHHCIYHSNRLHRHYWILFSPYGNERFFEIFFNRRLGSGNLLTPSPDKTDRLFSVCYKLMKCRTETEKYLLFFELISLLNASLSTAVPKTYGGNYITEAVSLINSRLTDRLTVKEISEKYNVSISTFERDFRRSLSIGPCEYIKKKRLANAARLLSLGKSVTEAAEMSGFSDVSRFIMLFKASYGITPLKYKKSLSER